MQFDEQTTDLVDFFQWEGAMQKQFDVDEVFGLETERTIGFEIVFTAFLATVILGAPDTQTILESLVPWVAGGLLLATLVRRMALDNIYIEEEFVIRKTMWMILALTNIAVLYLSLSLAGWISAVTGVHTYLLAGVLLILSKYGVVFVYEYIFHDFMVWFAILYYNDALSEDKDLSDIYRITALRMARLALSLSFVPYNEDHYMIRRIQAWEDDDVRTAGSIGVTLLMVVSLTIYLILFLTLALLLAWVLESPLIITVILSIALVTAFFSIIQMIQFVYGRYGCAEVQYPKAGMTSLRMVPFLFLIVLLHGGLLDKVAQFL